MEPFDPLLYSGAVSGFTSRVAPDAMLSIEPLTSIATQSNEDDEAFEKGMREREAVQYYEQHHCTQSEIARALNLSKKQAFNLVHHKRRMDGSIRPGRRTELSHGEERLLGTVINNLAEEGIFLSYHQVKDLALQLYRVSHPDQEEQLPVFSKRWLRGFNKRNEDLELVARHVSPITPRRAQASKVSNVAYSLNGIKIKVGECLSSHVYTADEFQISENGEGVGTRLYGSGHFMPVHATPDNAPHMTALPFISLSGKVIYIAFVIQAKSTPRFPDPDLDLRDSELFYNEKGSVDIENWRLIVKSFCQAVDKTHGSVSERNGARVVLLFDGYSVHHDEVALVMLEEHGVEVVCLSPNLTQVLQINDNGHINGRIQGRLRYSWEMYSKMNHGKLPSHEQWCSIAQNVIRGYAVAPEIQQAAIEVGFRFDDGFQHVYMDNDSIETTLRELLRKGKIVRNLNKGGLDDGTLRSPDYLAVLKALHESGITHPVFISEMAVKIAADYSEWLKAAKTGHAPMERPRRVLRRGYETLTHAGGTTQLTNPSTSQAARHLQIKIEAAKQVDERRRARAEQQASKKRRMEELQAFFPNEDLSTISSIQPFLRGQRTIDQARTSVERVRAKRLKELPPPPIPPAAEGRTHDNMVSF